MKEFAIVVVGYNRLSSLNRLLNSLNEANYNGEDIPLIISLDNSGDSSLELFADKFEWIHGEKIVRTFPKRQGLRKHMFSCGEYLKYYEAIAVLEDDIFVSKDFYNYAKQAIRFYKNDSNIAGISLYNFEVNPNLNAFFTPQKSEYDTYFIQFAQSWGQIWIKEKWDDFFEWYKSNSEEFTEEVNIPNNVCQWPKTSWLKYHIKYCIEREKYFVYPYTSLSTNFGDIGQHSNIVNPSYQVSLQYGSKEKYNFAPLNSSSIKYDAFFERECLGKYLKIKEDDLCVDLYGQKNNKQKRRYWLTMTKNNYKIVDSYSLSLRPQEMNIIKNIKGECIFLYDTKTFNNNSEIIRLNNFFNRQLYNFRTKDRFSLLKYVTKLYWQALNNKVKKLKIKVKN